MSYFELTATSQTEPVVSFWQTAICFKIDQLPGKDELLHLAGLHQAAVGVGDLVQAGGEAEDVPAAPGQLPQPTNQIYSLRDI